MKVVNQDARVRNMPVPEGVPQEICLTIHVLSRGALMQIVIADYRAPKPLKITQIV
jgi:hypothetical protein